jgi:DNA gyrase/topoisomerase IV subunit B
LDTEHLYIAVPPIYRLKQGKKEEYIYPPEDDLDACIEKY